MPSDKALSFSVIIATFNNAPALKRCLQELIPQLQADPICEVIVVDDGSTQGLCEYENIRRDNQQVRFYTHAHAGPAAARNYGASKARGTIILFLDDDSIPSHNWLKTTYQAWQKNPNSAGIGGYILTEGTHSFPSRVTSEIFNWYLSETSRDGATTFLSTCNAGYRKSTFEKLQGFDTRFVGAYGEDRDITLRAHAAGKVLKSDSSILVRHDTKLSFSAFFLRHFNYGRGAYIIYQKYPLQKHLSNKSYRLLIKRICGAFSTIPEKLIALLLTGLSQGTTFCGYCWEWICSQKQNSWLAPLTPRLDANLGYECNNHCLFCYFKNRKQHRPNPSTEEAQRLLSKIRRLGTDALEITGGEATIRPDFLSLVSFAKHTLGFPHITVITNGSTLYQESFAAQAIKNGIDDVLISLHGHTEELHDTLTGRTGSFHDACNTIHTMRKLGIICRSNTVITTLNYQHSSDIAQLLLRLGVKKINYIFFSPLDDALQIEKNLWPRYSQAAPYIKSMIDTYKSSFETISIKVIPFCVMTGYEDSITNLFQNIYDPFEWEFFSRVRIRRGNLIGWAGALSGMCAFVDIGQMMRLGWHRSLREGIVRTQAFRECTKSPACKQCSFDSICPGIWKAYAKEFGLTELQPIAQGTKKIADTWHPLKNRFFNNQGKR